MYTIRKKNPRDNMCGFKKADFVFKSIKFGGKVSFEMLEIFKREEEDRFERFGERNKKLLAEIRDNLFKLTTDKLDENTKDYWAECTLEVNFEKTVDRQAIFANTLR